MNQFRLTLLRHGETSAPKNLNGSTDIALSDLGYQQMQAALKPGDEFDQITTSPLQRCHHFAKDRTTQWLIPLTIEPDLREIGFGDWDGQAMQTLSQRYPKDVEQFWKTPWQFTPPNGETMQAFTTRVDSAWDSLIKQQKNTLVICHSGVIRYLIAKVLEMPIPGNNHMISLHLGFAARVDIDVTVEDNGKVWQTLQWPQTPYS